MKIEDGKKLHAKYSASGSERWLNCPGSPALSLKAPPQPENRYAVEGTDGHTCLETFLKNRNIPAYKIVKLLQGRFPDSMIEYAANTAMQIYSLIPKGAELLCETEVRLDFVEPGMFGTVDAGIVEMFGVLWVIDYKYGAGRLVNPENNSQAIYYALGIAHKYHFNFDVVRLAIAQPRIAHKDGIFRTWDMPIPELKKWTGIFKEGVERCKDPFADLNPGRWCFFCPAQDICPAIHDGKFNQAQKAFDDGYTDEIFDNVK